MSFVVGITGGIASGKSLACRELGLPLVDADQIAREVLAPGQPGLAELVATFGDKMLLPDGSLDRPALRALISADENARLSLNQITHPRILEAMRAEIEALKAKPVILASAALMIETGSFLRYQAVLLITAPYELRLERLVWRDGISESEAHALMSRQMSDEEKRARLNASNLPWAEVINDGPIASLRGRCLDALAQIARSMQPSPP